jgi:DNA repair photolyase
MALKKVKGEKSNMYRFISDTWNPVRGKCPYDCSYCYVKKWGNEQKPLFLDESYLKDDMGKGRFIFVCSGCDLFHPDIPREWIARIHSHTIQYPGNKYLWHTKNPFLLVNLIEPSHCDTACVTIESNRVYRDISKAPLPIERITYLNRWEGQRMITVEPILDFDLDLFGGMLLEALPVQVNIGADSGNNRLPEPPAWKVRALIEHLEKYNVVVHQKRNLARILTA